MSFMYTSKELHHLEKLLEKKLFDLKSAEQSAKEPPSEFSELTLTQHILKFVQYLVNKELVELSTPSHLAFDYTQSINGVGRVLENRDTSTICENCRQKNPSHTHCVHRVMSSIDHFAGEYRDQSDEV